MARNELKEYWTSDLPKGSEALTELDKFAEDQGMISRSDATRMILIAWAKARRGQDSAVWSGAQPTAPAQAASPLQGQTQEYRPRRALNGNAAAAELDL